MRIEAEIHRLLGAMASRVSSSLALVLVLIAAAIGVVWRYPLFHIVPLEQAQAASRAAEFDAQSFAAEFWAERLTAHFGEAADASAVLAALKHDLAGAREKFGHQVGVSRTVYYFLRGSGAVVAVDMKGVRIELAADGEGGGAEAALSTGPVFGNAVRDATGLLPPGEFANSQHFNALAMELNRLAEAGPIRRLKDQAAVGQTVKFVGCASVTSARDVAPLNIVPLEVTIESPAAAKDSP